MNLRAAYCKTGRMRFLAHLDLARTFHRALSRADIPIAHSEGFNPQPRVAFGPPVSLGVEGLEEWVDLTLLRDLEPGAFLEKMNAALSEGLGFTRAFVLTKRAASLGSVIRWARYRVTSIGDPQVREDAVRALLAASSVKLIRHSKKGDREIEVRDRVKELAVNGKDLVAVLACGPEGSLGILDLMCHLTGLESAGVLASHRVVREELLAERDGLPIAVSELTEEGAHV